MRTVAVKSNAGTMNVILSLQHSLNVEPGWNALKTTLTVHILNVPDTVTDLEALDLYGKTAIWHSYNSPFTVDYSQLGEGRKLIVKGLDDNLLVGLKEAADLLGWKKQQVTEYIRRGKFPPAFQTLASGPVWERSTIEDYRDSRK